MSSMLGAPRLPEQQQEDETADGEVCAPWIREEIESEKRARQATEARSRLLEQQVSELKEKKKQLDRELEKKDREFAKSSDLADKAAERVRGLKDKVEAKEAKVKQRDIALQHISDVLSTAKGLVDGNEVVTSVFRKLSISSRDVQNELVHKKSKKERKEKAKRYGEVKAKEAESSGEVCLKAKERGGSASGKSSKKVRGSIIRKQNKKRSSEMIARPIDLQTDNSSTAHDEASDRERTAKSTTINSTRDPGSILQSNGKVQASKPLSDERHGSEAAARPRASTLTEKNEDHSKDAHVWQELTHLSNNIKYFKEINVQEVSGLVRAMTNDAGEITQGAFARIMAAKTKAPASVLETIYALLDNEYPKSLATAIHIALIAASRTLIDNEKEIFLFGAIKRDDVEESSGMEVSLSKAEIKSLIRYRFVSLLCIATAIADKVEELHEVRSMIQQIQFGMWDRLCHALFALNLPSNEQNRESMTLKQWLRTNEYLAQAYSGAYAKGEQLGYEPKRGDNYVGSKSREEPKTENACKAALEEQDKEKGPQVPGDWDLYDSDFDSDHEFKYYEFYADFEGDEQEEQPEQDSTEPHGEGNATRKDEDVPKKEEREDNRSGEGSVFCYSKFRLDMDALLRDPQAKGFVTKLNRLMRGAISCRAMITSCSPMLSYTTLSTAAAQLRT